MKILTSPKGIALRPYLNSPNTELNPLGNYQVTLALYQAEEAQAFITSLQAELDCAVAKAKKEHRGRRIKAAEMPIDEEAEDGRIHIRFKLLALIPLRGKEPFSQKPALFDSRGNPMNKKIRDGSVIKVACEPAPFYTPSVGAGVTLRLRAVQVLSLALSWSDASFRSFGFVEEAGYLDDESG